MPNGASRSFAPCIGGFAGPPPTGRPYRADDPHLLGWIHVAEVDSFLASYQAFGTSRLDPDGGR